MKSTSAYDWMLEHRHPIFLGGLLSFFIVPEILDKIFGVHISFEGVLVVLIVTSILIIQTSPKKRFLSYVLVLVLVSFVIFVNYYDGDVNLNNYVYLFLFAYFSFITYYLFKDLLRSKKITSSVIIGAFAGYFLIGVIWFFIFGYLDSYFPDTVNVELDGPAGVQDMFYFSFITLTTIGYGDFSPTSELGQKVAVLEGLVGQFYIAIVMAILVGKFLSGDANAEEQNPAN